MTLPLVPIVLKENFCNSEDSPKIPFISDQPSFEVIDNNNEFNCLYTIEVKFNNEKKFLTKVEETFKNWMTSLVSSSGWMTVPSFPRSSWTA